MPRKPQNIVRDKILVVESNDEVFACIFSVLYGHFSEIIRTKSAIEADHLLPSINVKFVLSSDCLPDQSVWLMVKKWRLSGVRTSIWVYSAAKAKELKMWKRFSSANGVIVYKKSIISLACKLRDKFCTENDSGTKGAFTMRRYAAAALAALTLFASGCATGKKQPVASEYQPATVNPFDSQGKANSVATTANPAPSPNIAGQKRCPVTGDILDSNHPGVPVTWNGEMIFVSDEASAQKFLANPSLYLPEQTPKTSTETYSSYSNSGFSLSDRKSSCGCGSCKR